MPPYKPGLYDQLLTRRLHRYLTEQKPPSLEHLLESLDDAEAPDYIARHLFSHIKSALRSVPAAKRRERQIHIANKILARLREEDLILDDPQILKALYSPPVPPRRPTTPLSASNLLINARDEPSLGHEIAAELESADSVSLIVSFILWRGWLRLKSSFDLLAQRRVPVRILTTTYTGATELRALEALAALPNVELKISLDSGRRRLHAKAWLFHRDNGFSSAYIGSANLSQPALEDGMEWTVKLSEVESPHIIAKYLGAFDSLWAEDEFHLYNPADAELIHKIRLALNPPSNAKSSAPVHFFDLTPHPYQQATLDQLLSERLDHNSWRNLVVAPTGTGKTLTAAFDYRRQWQSGPPPRLLFLAHREELLQQAIDELLAAGREPASHDHLFATIQSFHSRNLLALHGPEYWRFVVLDEAHHAPAETYQSLIPRLNPQILLGLTATPERMDGQSILGFFNHRIADEMRLWHAIERHYLVPFEYYGLHDGTDLSRLSWSRGAYSAAELEQNYLANQRRTNLILSHFTHLHPDHTQARALAFCVSISHANYMAAEFNRANIPALAVTSHSSPEERADAPRKLRNREVNVLFTVDLFNEGVDIPEADTVLFLRPTESATVFLQQLGRGLRRNSGKHACLVLDFIGNQRREFRFDLKLSALLGGTRKQIQSQLETGVKRLPGN
jgi:superfamily II DNA or RNA helicase/HKD family nuclease